MLTPDATVRQRVVGLRKEVMNITSGAFVQLEVLRKVILLLQTLCNRLKFCFFRKCGRDIKRHK